MKKILILSGLICLGNILSAQQLPQVTQYMINSYVVNPAVSGMEDFYQVKTNIRNQWVGIADAPRTTILSVYGSKNENVALGGMVFNDETGPTSRIGGNVSYTYSFSISKSMNMAFALSGGFTQYKLIKSGLNVQHENDGYLQGGDVVRSLPDATFGVNLSGKNWYIGAAIPQLLSTNLNLLDENFTNTYEDENEGALTRHIYVLGEYNHSFNALWAVSPSMLIKTVAGAPLQLDVGVKGTYNNNLWAGMNYRNNGELAALLGYSIKDRYTIGYSYDMMSALGSSHEFMLGVRFIDTANKK